MSRLSKFRHENGFTLIELLVAVLIIGILAAIAIPAFLNQQEVVTKKAGSPKATSGATPTPAPSTHAASSFDPGPMLGVGLAILMFAAAAAIVFFMIRRVVLTTRAKQQVMSVQRKHLKSALASFNSTMLRQAEYETDLGKLINFPMMSNYGEPTVRAFVSSMQRAQQIKDSLPAKNTPSSLIDSFAAAAESFKIDFETAEREAERVRWSRYSNDERKRLRDAQTALTIVMDQTYLPEQRQAQYKRIVSLLEGLVHVPQKTLLSLSSSAQLHALAA